MKKGIWKKYDKCTERHSLKNLLMINYMKI